MIYGYWRSTPLIFINHGLVSSGLDINGDGLWDILWDIKEIFYGMFNLSDRMGYIKNNQRKQIEWVCNDKWFETQNHTSCVLSGKVMIQMWATL